MAKKQKLLKNLLTSVSVASIVASIGGSSGAFALNIGAGPNVYLDAVAGFAAGGPGDRELNFDYAGVTLTVNVAQDIADIITTEAGNTIIAESMAITGRVVGPNSATATINNNKTLTISARDHEGLGAVTLNGADATLTLVDAATVHNTIKGAADGQGILNLGIGSTVNAEIGGVGNSLATVAIGAGDVNVNHNVFAANTNLIAGSVLKLAAGKTITGDITATAGNGTLTFLGAAGGGVTGNIGTNVASLLAVNIGGGEVTLGGNVFATNTNLIAGSVLKLAAGKTITGDITATAGNGTLTFLGAAGGGVTGNIGTNAASLLAVNIGGGEVTLGGNVFAANTNVIAGSVLKLAAGKTITGDITATAGNGTLTFLGAAGGGVTGNIGTNAASLLAVNIGGGEVTLGGNVFAANTNLIAGSVLKLAAGKTITGDITATAGNGTLTFLGAAGGGVTGNIGTNAASLLAVNIGGGEVTLGGNVFAANTNLIAGSVLKLAAGKTITGDITATAGNGTLTFLGAAGGGVTGNIGTNAASLLAVNIGGGEVTLGGNVFAANTNLIAGSVLKLAVGKTITGNITTGADGEGTLTFLGAAGGGVTGNIGTNVASLLAVNIGGGEVTLGGNVFATNTNLIAGSVLKLAAGKTITGNITTGDDGEGTLTFLGAGTVTGNIGADVLALAEINITDPANAGPAVVQLKGDVYTKKLNFVTNNQVEIAGNFGGGAKVGGVAGAAGEVDFDAAGGTLTFNGGRGVGDLKT